MAVRSSTGQRRWCSIGLAVLSLSACSPAQPKRAGGLLVADPIEGQGSAGEGVADFDRGLGLVKKGAWADAIGYFDKALAAAPKRAEAEYYRALAKEHVGDHAGAEQGYSRALELDPKLVEASINLGALCLDTDGESSSPRRARPWPCSQPRSTRQPRRTRPISA